MRNNPVNRRERIEFLKAVGEGYSIRKAALIAGRAWPRVFYLLAEKDPEFKEALRLAVSMGTDLLRDEARRRAVEGVEEPVYQGGQLVGTKTVYSDRLLELELRRRDPAYRDSAAAQPAVSVKVEIDDRSASLADVFAVLQLAGAVPAELGGSVVDGELAGARELLAAPVDGEREAGGVPVPGPAGGVLRGGGGAGEV